jgi:mannose-6-phosphate isomerase-like protein (cupin superfamily)/AraC-like DNA-binding protein
MARHIRAEQVEGVARPIVSVGNDYPNGHQHPPHKHRRDQLLFAERGTMLVQTEHGSWVVPTSQGIWIPGGTTHGMTMLGDVATRSVYLEPAVVGNMPKQCHVVSIGALLRQLLIAAVDLPCDYNADSRAGKIMSLLVEELAGAPMLSLDLPLPRDRRLAARCRRFVECPTMLDTIDTWRRDLALSCRTLTRRFRRETGLSLPNGSGEPAWSQSFRA